MKKRNLAAVITLGFLTLGIYIAYWLYATRKDIVAENHNPDSVPSIWWLLSGFIGILAAVLFEILTSLLSHGHPAGAIAVTNILMIFVVIGCFALISILPFWWFWKYCWAIGPIVKGMEPTLLYTLSILLNLAGLTPVWMLIVQDQINRSIDASAAATAAGSEHAHSHSHHDQLAQPQS